MFLRSLSPLPDPVCESLKSRVKPLRYKRGEYIVTPGQVQRNLLFVKTGVQVSYVETDQRQHVVAFTYPPGPCAIPDSFQQQIPSRHYLQCVSDSEFDSLSFDNLQELFDESRELERLFRKMTEAILAGVIARHLELQTLTIEERFRSFMQRSPHLLQLVPHKLIASYLDISTTNFSKLYNSVKI